MKNSDFEKEHPTPLESGHNSLYRFMTVTTQTSKSKEDPQFLKELLLDGKLFLQSPSMFNDPFECKPHFSMSNTHAPSFRKHILSQARRRAIQSNTKFDLAAASKAATKFITDHDFANKSINETLLKVFQSNRICCFTPNRENLLFWSHYAKSHKGVCIEFDSTYPPMSGARKVSYTDTYPAVIYPFPSDLDAVVPILTKSKEWEYEEEFRISLRENNPHFIFGTKCLQLGIGSIKSITLGACISDKDKETAIEIARESKFTPKIFQSKLSEAKFELVFDEIK